MPPPRLLLGFRPDDGAVAILARDLPDVAWAVASSTDLTEWGSAEALLVGDLRRELPTWAPRTTPRLRLIQCLHTGLDTFPFDRVPTSIAVAGNGGAYAPFVAERALALILELAHHLPANHAAARAGQLRPASANRFLLGSRLVILGFGAIGTEVARRAIACGATVDAVTRDGQRPSGVERAFPSTSLAEAVAGADVIVDCRPLTERTRGSVDAAVLRAMKPEASFINVGRAATVDERALFDRLTAVPTFSAAVDVWWQEDYPHGHLGASFPFTDLPNFVGTPHNAAIGLGARERGFRCAVENLKRFFTGTPPRFVADRSEYG